MDKNEKIWWLLFEATIEGGEECRANFWVRAESEILARSGARVYANQHGFDLGPLVQAESSKTLRPLVELGKSSPSEAEIARWSRTSDLLDQVGIDCLLVRGADQV